MNTNENTGVYAITIKNFVYVGQSSRLSIRGVEHNRKLQKGIHTNPVLQDGANMCGLESFQYQILEYCDAEDLMSRETFYINKFRKAKGWIICNDNNGNGGSLGSKHKNSSSDFTGVTLCKRDMTYVAQVWIDGKQHRVGSNKNELEAAKMYDLFVMKHNLPNKLNFSWK